MHQLLLALLCASCGASALGTSIPAVSTLNFTGLGSAQRYRTDTTAKIRKRRYISQNDMLAILDYHNKVRGRVFPPASNMEYMVSERFLPTFPKLCSSSSSSSSCWFTLAYAWKVYVCAKEQLAHRLRCNRPPKRRAAKGRGSCASAAVVVTSQFSTTIKLVFAAHI